MRWLSNRRQGRSRRMLSRFRRLMAPESLESRQLLAAGRPDSGFGSSGTATYALGVFDDYAQAVAAQADGGIVVAGSTTVGLGDEDLAIIRVTPDGTLDSTFGSGGAVTARIGSRIDRATDVEVLPDGRILVAGYARILGDDDFVLLRYLADGTPDTSFGSGGMVATHFGYGHDRGFALATQADGRILVAGTAWNGLNADLAVARYRPDGALDAAFGDGGRVVVDVAFADDLARDVAVQADGRIVVAGAARIGPDLDFAVARLEADGTLDAGFGSFGLRTRDFAGGDDGVYSLAVDPAGRLVVTGFATVGMESHFATARYSANGNADLSFGSGGSALLSFGVGNDEARAVELAGDGRILVAGTAVVGGVERFALARYDATGALDAAFGDGGRASVSLGDASWLGGMVLPSPSRVLLAGSAWVGGDFDFGLAQFYNDALVPDAFEPNDQPSAPFVLGPVEGDWEIGGLSRHASEDDDWFEFDLTATGGGGHAVIIEFEHVLGDVDMALYNAPGDMVDFSWGVTDREEISLDGLPAGTYRLRVYGGTASATSPEYRLTIHAPGEGDQFEPNNWIDQATDLGELQGQFGIDGLSISRPGDEDWFHFVTNGPANAGHGVGISFSHSRGDLDLWLYDDHGNLVDASFGTTDREEISLLGLPAGGYYIQVDGFDGAVNPDYSLRITAPGQGTIAPDRYEPNGAPPGTDLGVVAGFRTWNDLSIHAASDADWFRLETTATATEGHFVRIDFVHALGDIDLWIYDNQGTTVGRSLGVTNREEISLAGLPAGVYYVEAEGFLDATNPAYHLTVNTPGASAGDRFEANDARGTATDLERMTGRGQFVGDGLSIHTADDEDWFRIRLDDAASAAHFVRADFSHSLGDLDVSLYDERGDFLAGSNGIGDREEISLEGLPSGTYYVRVYGFGDDTNPYYRLWIQTPGGGPAQDAFEPNDSAAQATELGSLHGRREWSGLSIHPAGDADWYAFELGRGAVVGHRVQLEFRHAQGDIDAGLYEADGTTLLGRSNTTTDRESISLAGLPPGRYLLRVYGYGGAANPDYVLTIDAPGVAAEGDRYEPNNGREAIPGTLADLGIVRGQRLIGDLSIHPQDDEDWFRLETTSAGTASHGLAIAFNHAAGDLDMDLVAADGSLLQRSASTRDFEVLTLSGLPRGVYFVRVYGFGGDMGSYDMLIAAPGGESTADAHEPNDSRESASDLGRIEGVKTIADLTVQPEENDDWFAFETAAAASLAHEVAIAFDHDQGDLDLELYGDGEGLLRVSAGTADGERISLAGLPAGTYRIRVYGYEGATNPQYTLSLVTPAAAAGLDADPLEGPAGNDLRDAARDLGRVDTGMVQSGLSIHAANNDDWYRFQTLDEGSAEHGAGIVFSHTMGDLDLELYDATGRLLGESLSTSDAEWISLAGRAAGDYFLRVTGYAGAVNPDYTLSIVAPGEPDPAGLTPDAAEGDSGNDVLATAHDLGTVRGSLVRTDLSVHSPADQDWYRFETLAASHSRHGLGIFYSPEDGDLRAELYDSAGVLLGVSAGAAGLQAIALADLPAGQYYLRVAGVQGATSRSYALAIEAPEGAAAERDWAEGVSGNDGAEQAYAIGEVVDAWSGSRLSLHASDDEDWYRFTTPVNNARAPTGVVLGFDHEEGDLQLELYAEDGHTLLARSAGTGHLEQVALPPVSPGTAAGGQTYLVRVYGDVNSQYVLSLWNPALTGQAAGPAGLSGSRSSGQILADAFEAGDGNSDFQHAADLGPARGVLPPLSLSIHSADDDDWLHFRLAARGESRHSLGISFDARLADLDLELYAADGTTLVDASRGVTGTEQVPLDGLAEGDYYARVYSYQGAADYTFSWHGPAGSAQPVRDWAEPNAQASPRDLGRVNGILARQGLSIESGDEDWFEFETYASGGEAHAVQIDFLHEAGDLDIFLYGENRTTRLASSTGVGNRESLSLAGRPAGVYHVRVVGYAGAANPAYSLTIAAPAAAAAGGGQWPVDALEPNNGPDQARDLGGVRGPLVRRDLSIHEGDQDWYRFTTVDTGGRLHGAGIYFDRSQGDLDLALYSGDGRTLLERSAGADNLEAVSLHGRGPGTFLLHVSAAGGGAHPSYALAIDAPAGSATSIAPDRAEPNDDRGQAFPLREAGGSGAARSLRTQMGSDLPVWVYSQMNAMGIPLPAGFPSAGTVPYEYVQLGPHGNPVSGMFNNGVAPSQAMQSGATPISFVHNQLQPHLGGFNVGQLINSVPSLGGALAGLAGLPGGGAALNSVMQSVSLGFGGSNYPGSVWNWSNQPPQGVFGMPTGMPIGMAPGGSVWPATPSPTPALIVPSWDAAFSPPASGGLGTGFVGMAAAPVSTGSGSGGQIVQLPPAPDLPDEVIAGVVAAPLTTTLTGLTIHHADDFDWFTFELREPGRTGDFVRIRFDHGRGDLDLELFDDSSSDEPLRRSNGRQDSEEISLAGLRRGTYYVQVSGFGGATSTGYSLEISVSGAADGQASAGDSFEPNDEAEASYDLRAVSGRRILSGLAIDPQGDEDWFQFETASAAASGHALQIDFVHARGDLDMELYRDGETQPLARSNGTSNREEISLAGLAPGIYQVRVYGYRRAANPSYTLTLNSPGQALVLSPDRMERPLANDGRDTPTLLGTLVDPAVLADLTLTPGDHDWFRIETQATGAQGDEVRLGFDRAFGALKVELYGNGPAALRTSTEASNYEVLSLEGLGAGTYWLHVFSPQGSANRYELRVDPPAQVPDDWTIMVYMTASDLETAAAEDINEMERMVSQLGGTVNFAVLWDQNSAPVEQNGQLRAGRTFATPIRGQGGPAAWGDTGRALIRGDSHLVDSTLAGPQAILQNTIVTPFERLGELNTGNPQTLVDFVEWAVQTAPAQRYALILWDHGSGLWGTNRDHDPGPPGASWDDLTNPELVSALATLRSRGGPRLDLLGFDACLAAMLEVTYELRDFAEIIVASQENEGGDGWEYQTAFGVLRSDPAADAERLAGSLIASYEARYWQDAEGLNTLSAVRTDRLSDLADSLGSFAAYVVAGPTSAADWIATIRAAAAAPPMSDVTYRDLGAIMDRLARNTSAGSTLRSLAADVLRELDNTVVHRTQSRSDVHGLSVYLNPAGTHPSYDDQYGDYLDASLWDRFLAAFQPRARALLAASLLVNQAVAAGFQNRGPANATDWAEANDRPGDAFPLHRLSGAGHAFAGLTLHDGADEDYFVMEIPVDGGQQDALRARYDRDAGSLRLELLDAQGDPLPGRWSASGTGVETVSLNGLEAGEYTIRITGSAEFLPYVLEIDAPQAAMTGDWIEGNHRMDKAHDLDVLNQEFVASGLQVGAAEDTWDWFQFTTPRTESAATGFARVHALSGPVGLELFDSGGRSLGRAAGNGLVELPFASGGGAAYRLAIRSESGGDVGYTLDLVNPQNSLPWLDALADQTARDGEPFTFQVQASDPDGHPLTYSFAGDIPEGASIDADTGEIRWTPTEAQSPGVFALAVRVTDRGTPPLSAEHIVTVHVQERNDAPTAVSLLTDTVAENEAGATIGTLTVVDPDANDTHTFRVSDPRFEVLGGRLVLRAGEMLDHELQPALTLNVTAVDAGGLEVTKPLSLTVLDVNEAPSWQQPVPDQAGEENQPWTLTFAADTFADVDLGDALTYSARQADGSSLPDWLHVDGGARRFSGTPRLGDAGEVRVTLTATDRGGLAAQASFAITISPDPHPWRNPGLTAAHWADVDADGTVAPLDVLRIINDINAHGSRPLPRPGNPADVERSYYDVDGDNAVSPQDVLFVINFLNRRAAEGEGDGGPAAAWTGYPAEPPPSGRSPSAAPLASPMGRPTAVVAARRSTDVWSDPLWEPWLDVLAGECPAQPGPPEIGNARRAIPLRAGGQRLIPMR